MLGAGYPQRRVAQKLLFTLIDFNGVNWIETFRYNLLPDRKDFDGVMF
jgi:hypothetical protein